ncbi:MAG TPA: methyltransferase domain-containing protein [Methylocystis sp.]|nr:methyltransferase domain-containing protein [Methylocystis sp.]
MRSLFDNLMWRPGGRYEPNAPAPLIADFFDAAWYRAENPEVAASGLDPWTHYLDVGARAGLAPGPRLEAPGDATFLAFPRDRVRDRRAFLRQRAGRAAKALEIGPAFNPLLPKAEGNNVYTVDNADRDELRRRYGGFREIDVDRIEQVDFIWKDADILSAVPRAHWGSFDVVLMCDVLEHIPNPIRLLQSLQKLLKPGGCISLAVPDKRQCFDCLRPLTTTGGWLEALQRGDVRHTARTLFDYKTLAVARRGRVTWVERRLEARDATFVGAAPQHAYADYFESPSEDYVDAHAWVFTPSSFTLIINECHALGLISIVPERVSLRRGGEFLAHLRLAYRRPINHHERLQLLLAGAREQAEGFSVSLPAGGRLRSWFRNGLALLSR